MIGLKRGTLEVVDPDPDWATVGAEVCQALRKACGELLVDVQHVGSTAVPELPAKPILDIAAGVATLEATPELTRRLADIGYCFRRDHGNAGGRLFVVDASPEIRTIHLHVVKYGDGQWRDYLRFRDLLRETPAMRERYGELKQALARICRHDWESYTAAKADFIREVLGHDRERAGGSQNEHRDE
jgi:GrpB-like predicted nucleotidyltransferase (UPF0157 family)